VADSTVYKNANITDGNQKTQIVDAAGDIATVNSEGRLDVVQHAHPDSSILHFDVALAASTNFTLIDISDTTNYPHVNTGSVHLEWLKIAVDATAAANYEVELGFLENVDATNSDIYIFNHIIGTRTAGQVKEIFQNFYPNGGRLTSSKLVTHDIRLNNATFQTDVNQKTTLDPSTADTPSGDGDLIVIVDINAGEVDLSIDCGYHSHS
jgi:hypothetical protein